MPEKTPGEREAIALAMWDNLGRVMAESILLDRIFKDPSRIEYENPALIARYQDKMGAMVVLVPAHGQLGGRHLARQRDQCTGGHGLPHCGKSLCGPLPHRLRAPLYPRAFREQKGRRLQTVMRIASFVRQGGTSACWPTSPTGGALKFLFSGT